MLNYNQYNAEANSDVLQQKFGDVGSIDSDELLDFADAFGYRLIISPFAWFIDDVKSKQTFSEVKESFIKLSGMIYGVKGSRDSQGTIMPKSGNFVEKLN